MNSRCPPQTFAASISKIPLNSSYVPGNQLGNLPVVILLALVVILAGCSLTGPEETPGTDRTIPPIKTAGTAVVETSSPPPQATLSVVYPLSTGELMGGQPLRVTLFIEDDSGVGVEGADAQVELWTPGGVLFTTMVCADAGGGRYLSDYVPMPMKGTTGPWLVKGQARLENGRTLTAERMVIGQRSFSEGLEELYGFWIDTSSPLFAYVGPHIADPADKFHPYPDAGGYVILANTQISGTVENFVMLDVHWRPIDFPEDESTAENYVQDLAGPHGMTVAISNLDAQPTSIQGRSAWYVEGQWHEPEVGQIIRLGPDTHSAEWLVFTCPGSNWLWTLLITTNKESNMDDLRAMQKSFECPAPK